jgi:hypothetical protein
VVPEIQTERNKINTDGKIRELQKSFGELVVKTLVLGHAPSNRLENIISGNT